MAALRARHVLRGVLSSSGPFRRLFSSSGQNSAPVASLAAVAHSDFGNAPSFYFRPCARFASTPAASHLLEGAEEEHQQLKEIYNRHRTLIVLQHKEPEIAPDAWVAPNATVIGQVTLEDRAIVWYGSVLRGDIHPIHVGAYSNLQDKVVVHTSEFTPTGLSAEVSIGQYVTIGAGSTLRSCIIEDEVIVGRKCVLEEGVLLEKHSILGDGSVIEAGHRIPSGEFWEGKPAKFVRTLSADEKADISKAAETSWKDSQEHIAEFYLPYSTAYLEAEQLKASLAKK
eukprot:TRINITY_DN1379_c1_g1_i1.p1 TRINITY_DN1379_c1_g1~~TRINITY_DN1379_c1_g1_i1.p1  ORF type:complete len:284 (+),score=57.15 TRINITY_DN1379_c1_g1_i1:54-905(+)